MKPPVAVPAVTADELQHKLLGPHLGPRSIALDWPALAVWMNDVRERVQGHGLRGRRNAATTKAAVRLSRELHKRGELLKAEVAQPGNMPTQPPDAAAVAKHLEIERILQMKALVEDKILPTLDPQRAPRGGQDWGSNWESAAYEVWAVIESLFTELYLEIDYQPDSPFIELAVRVLRRLGFLHVKPDALVQLSKRRSRTKRGVSSP